MIPLAQFLRGLARLVILGALSFSFSAMAQSSEEAPDYSRKGADSCFACHDDQTTLAVFRSKHAVREDDRTPFGHGQLQCESCHGPGGDHAGRVRRGEERPPITAFGAESAMSVLEQNGLCTNCHQNDLGLAWHGGEHDMQEVSCAGCHTSHTAADPVLTASTQPEVCFDCHQQQRTQAMKPYAHPILDGKMGCSSCHSAHGATSDGPLVQSSTNDTCFGCHAEQRGPYLWEHAPVSENCGDCHDPHGSNYPGMLTMRAPMLCQSCHSQSGHPSIAQDAGGLPGGSPSPYLLGQSCMNCHSQVHGSNHPSGSKLSR
jgi:DmsE family decaheme c-type cytochrome